MKMFFCQLKGSDEYVICDSDLNYIDFTCISDTFTPFEFSLFNIAFSEYSKESSINIFFKHYGYNDIFGNDDLIGSLNPEDFKNSTVLGSVEV